MEQKTRNGITAIVIVLAIIVLGIVAFNREGKDFGKNGQDLSDVQKTSTQKSQTANKVPSQLNDNTTLTSMTFAMSGYNGSSKQAAAVLRDDNGKTSVNFDMYDDKSNISEGQFEGKKVMIHKGTCDQLGQGLYNAPAVKNSGAYQATFNTSLDNLRQQKPVAIMMQDSDGDARSMVCANLNF